MNILVPQGIGDLVWALHKVEDLARRHDSQIHLRVAVGHQDDPVECRALEFARRMKPIASVEPYRMWMSYHHYGCLLEPGAPTGEDGFFRYIPEGPPIKLPGIDFIMIPNKALERGIRLENWFPELATNWDFVPQNVAFTAEEKVIGDDFAKQFGDYVVFHMGSMGGNSYSGYNRGHLWKPWQWLELANKLHKKLGVRIVAVGAAYDRSYFDQLIRPQCEQIWIDTIGQWEVHTTWAVLMKARFMIGYPSGLSMIPTYLGQRTGIFWRPHGDSLLPDYHVSCDEGMSTAWVPPAVLEKKTYLPIFYGRHDADWIVEQILQLGW